MIYSNSKRIDLERMSSEIITLKDRIVEYQESVKSLQNSLRNAEKSKAVFCQPLFGSFQS